MVAYATRADVFDYGLPRGQLAKPGRRVSSVVAGTDTIELDGHGFESGAPVLVRAEAGGALPAPLVAGTTHYVLRQTDATFKLAATEGGAAINLTTDGSRMVVVEQLDARLDKLSEFYSRWVDARIIGHEVPFEAPFPVFVVGIVAKLVAGDLLELQGGASESSLERQTKAHIEIDRWSKGLHLRDENALGRSNLAAANTVPAHNNLGTYGCAIGRRDDEVLR